MTEMTSEFDAAAQLGNPAQAALRDTQSVTMDALKVAPTGTNMPAVINREPMTIESMGDVPVTLTFEVGRTHITIKQLMELNKGSFVELRHISVDTIDVRVCEKIIATAEAIGLQNWYGMRMGEIEIPATMELEQL